jgi:hypothetical protein
MIHWSARYEIRIRIQDAGYKMQDTLFPMIKDLSDIRYPASDIWFLPKKSPDKKSGL